MVDFKRSVVIQVHDQFASKGDIAEMVEFIREQKVPGELVIHFPGNGGVDSAIFKGKPQKHLGEIENGK